MVDYEVIIGTTIKGDEQLAIAQAATALREAVPDAEVFNVKVYGDDGDDIGVALNATCPVNIVSGMHPQFETVEVV